MNKLRVFIGDLKASFWFIPIFIVVLAIIAAVILLYLDNIHHFQPEGIIQYVFTGSADSARSVLSTISGAMIGVAGTVFSITLVALTLASSQFGPRLLRNFMHERINQVVLGTYIATYVYCLIVLNSVKDNDSIHFIPVLSVFMAIATAIANIILLIIFIHHIAISIQADKVISDINDSLFKSFKTLFPEEEKEDDTITSIPNIDSIKHRYQHKTTVLAQKSGYLQLLDIETSLKTATEEQQLIVLNFKPGEYIVEGIEIGSIYFNGKLKDDAVENLQSIYAIGKVRTPMQDAEFSIHQMVEIAARALSPGINDPYTAMACIDNLTSTLCYLTKVNFPSRYRFDDEGELRVLTDVLTFEGMINAAFNKIRQYANGSPAVVIRLMDALNTVHKFARNKEQYSAVKKHAEMVLRLAENSFNEENDLADLKERSQLIIPQKK
ncbi:MAG: DUF2254 domain-containing protein [Bacteroidetes bacterium]|nr:DUF2254 domain-containing protein [Bacteroidota bacterium]